MGFEKPTFAEMKGHAVTVMNYLVKQPSPIPSEFPVQFPIELRNIHSYQTFLINGTSGIICKDGVARELVREQDAGKPHSEDAWAFILVNVVHDPQRTALQNLMFPKLAPYVHVVEVFLDWQEAVHHAVLHAASSEWTKNVVAADEDDAEGQQQ
jgi:hypothetical protein